MTRKLFFTLSFSFLTVSILWGILINMDHAKGAETSALPFTIDNIYDGDTVYVTFQGVPDILGKHIGIRLRGLDTPEMRDKDPCVRNMAKVSRMTLVTFLKSGKTLVLTNLKRDKYYRLDADILVDGQSAVNHMLTVKRAQLYTGETAKPVWLCDHSWLAPQ